MKNKFAGILNILCGLISILLYVGVFFTFVMDQMQGNGLADCLIALLLAIIGSIPLSFLAIPAFMMFVVGREMLSLTETVRSEKLLIGLTIFFKFLLCFVFGIVGWILFIGENVYFSTYGIFLILGAILLCISWITDICVLVKNKIQEKNL